MQRSLNLLAWMLVVVVLVAACGSEGGADSGTTSTTAAPAPTATLHVGAAAATTTRDTATETSAPGEDAGDASPTAETTADPSPTEDQVPTAAVMESTVTDVATSTVTSDDPEPTETDAATSESTVDETLLSILLTEADLPVGWLVDNASVPVEAENTDGEELCGTEGFPDEARSIGQVTGQFIDESTMLIMLQKIWAFEEDVAVDAFAFWNDAAGCGEWVEDDDTRVVVERLDNPGKGDESFAVHVTFEANEDGLDQGGYSFIRSGSLLMLIAYVGTKDADFTLLAGLVKMATERLLEVAAQLETE